MAATKTETKTDKKTTTASPKASGYDPAVRRAIKHVREDNALNLILESYETDKAIDPVGYDPVLLLCNEVPLVEESFQQYRTKDTHDVFLKNSSYGGTRHLDKYRRYNNSHDASKNRRFQSQLK